MFSQPIDKVQDAYDYDFGPPITKKPPVVARGKFCWKNSYGRDVGTIPDGCPSDRDKIGSPCYSKCPTDYSRSGFDCYRNCPDGFRDDGLYCRLVEYGRGAGYAWQFGDPAFSDAGQFSRCENDNGRGNCEKDGVTLIVYPKCRSNYSAFGCCICRPNTPDCANLGFNGQLDLSCTKNIRIGDPTLTVCGQGKENDAGLCYAPCGATYKGIGPVCWAQGPPNWVECAAGYAKDQDSCGKVTSDQIFSTIFGFFSVVSIPDYEIVKLNLDVANTVKLAALSKNLHSFYSGVVTAENGKTLTAEEIVQLLTALNYRHSWVLAFSQLVLPFDPTALFRTAAAYVFPLCSNV